jgi:hypothetical protein
VQQLEIIEEGYLATYEDVGSKLTG